MGRRGKSISTNTVNFYRKKKKQLPPKLRAREVTKKGSTE